MIEMAAVAGQRVDLRGARAWRSTSAADELDAPLGELVAAGLLHVVARPPA